MLKKLLLSVFILISVCFNAIADVPIVEFIVDGEVIESRALTAQEMEQYQVIEGLEIDIEAIEQPLAQMEQALEIKGKEVELAVEAIVERAFWSNEHDELDEKKDRTLQELDLLMETLQPNLDEISIKAEEITEAAEVFEALLLGQYDKQEIDTIRIINHDTAHHSIIKNIN